ncbi:MAG: carboxymuconolactone decarboxylase family protein, partial [Burkholderiales bacterium]
MTSSARAESARLPVADERADAALAEVFAGIAKTRGKVSDVLRGLGHAPDGLRAFAEYGEYVRYRTTLSGRVRELAILALARGNQYAWTHHAPVALKEGVTQAELDELNAGMFAQTLSGAERAAIGYAREFAQGGNVGAATFAAA